MTIDLPADFVFGVAGSAAKIEGAGDADGRTASVWDAFADAPGRIVDGSRPAIAADHYHRMTTDVDLLADLGVQAYRFSVSWSRVQPGGSGPVNPAGIEFYDRLVDRLLDNDIAPWLTLHHWDLPVELMLQGGWLERDTVDRFADYVTVVAGRLADRVAAWITVTEPGPHTFHGHAVGIDAPGLTMLGAAFAAGHHQLLAHARAVGVLRATAPASMVGIVNHHCTVDPASDDPADRRAAELFHALHNLQYSGPVLAGCYPDPSTALPGTDLSVIADGDLAEIAAPLDFYGVNYDHPRTIAAAPDNRSIPFTMTVPPDHPITASGWPVHPAGLTRTLTELHECYPRLPPLYVTENGAAYTDPSVTEAHSGNSGPARDDERIAFLDGHLAAVVDARTAGVDVRGYFYGALLDGWEWTDGFTRPFGLVRVQRDTLERQPRASFWHYASIIAAIRNASAR
jgi:beta-glucosidase